MFELNRKENKRESWTYKCCECCVQFSFPGSPKGCSEAEEDSEVVKKYDKSFVDSLCSKQY